MCLIYHTLKQYDTILKIIYLYFVSNLHCTRSVFYQLKCSDQEPKCEWELEDGFHGEVVKTTGARGTDHPPFSNFLFTNLFSIKFLYFFIISSLFFLILSCSCQYSYNLMLTSNCMCRPYIDTVEY